MTPETARSDMPAGLQDELRYLLNRWDPIGSRDEHLDFPPDEYDCLIGPLLAKLARHDSRASLSEYLWHEIEDHFGLDPVDAEPTASPTACWAGTQRRTRASDQ